MRQGLLFIAGCMICLLSGCRQNDFTDAEKGLIYSSLGTMRVLTIEDSTDLAVLRAESCNFSSEALLSEEFSMLASLMLATVQHPSQDGVGIAAPQVGLNRRVVAVQRFDKVGEPFEVYPNVRLVWASDSTAYGMEGCLSVPDRYGEVLRSQEVVIEYADIEKLKSRQGKVGLRRSARDIPTLRDTVKGFTAVIFQHEIDHLNGRLYIDLLARNAPPL